MDMNKRFIKLVPEEYTSNINLSKPSHSDNMSEVRVVCRVIQTIDSEQN